VVDSDRAIMGTACPAIYWRSGHRHCPRLSLEGIATHIAVRCRSVNADKPFTCTGLGDRIHQCTIAWAYACAHDVPVTLHISQDKYEGGQFGNKPESWAEILALFPEGAISLHVHPVACTTEARWIAYLHGKGIDAQLYWYSDHPGIHESREELDASKYLKRIPLLKAQAQDAELPDSFITTQWDSSARRRTLAKEDQQKVLAGYTAQGYTPIVVGGQATMKGMGWILKRIAYAMSKARLHVGCDSAFMHLAILYLPPERIHLYNQTDGYFSHHALRWADNGVVARFTNGG